jgi:hypothetical protein
LVLLRLVDSRELIENILVCFRKKVALISDVGELGERGSAENCKMEAGV